jgi:hypothetical protein
MALDINFNYLRNEPDTLSRYRSRLKLKEQAANKSFEDLKEELSSIKGHNSGLGKYRELRAVRKSQKNLYPNRPGGTTVIPEEYIDSLGSYQPSTREIRIAEPSVEGNFVNPSLKNYYQENQKATQEAIKKIDKNIAETRRHEVWHDIQNASVKTGEPIAPIINKIAPLPEDSENVQKLKKAVISIVKEAQARIVAKKNPILGLADMVENASGYADSGDKIKNVIYKTMSVAETPAKLIKQAFTPDSSVAKSIDIVKNVGSGVVRGLAEAPAYEFLNPPSAGPSDPEDPIYQFERGLISQDEFIRRLKQ